MGRKILFENVVKNLKLGRYDGKITSADYANTGVQLFDERKFADNLGVSFYQLREMGLIKITEQAGWKLPTKPSVEELIKFREQIEAIQ